MKNRSIIIIITSLLSLTLFGANKSSENTLLKGLSPEIINTLLDGKEFNPLKVRRWIDSNCKGKNNLTKEKQKVCNGLLTNLREYLSEIDVSSCKVKNESKPQTVSIFPPDGPYQGLQICSMSISCTTNGKIKLTKRIYCEMSYCYKNMTRKCYETRYKVAENTMSLGTKVEQKSDTKVEDK